MKDVEDGSGKCSTALLRQACSRLGNVDALTPRNVTRSGCRSGLPFRQRTSLIRWSRRCLRVRKHASFYHTSKSTLLFACRVRGSRRSAPFTNRERTQVEMQACREAHRRKARTHARCMQGGETAFSHEVQARFPHRRLPLGQGSSVVAIDMEGAEH